MLVQKNLENFDGSNLAPLGVTDEGQTVCLELEEQYGVMTLFGRPGNGKSLTLESLIISQIVRGRGGMFIDPYGDIIENIKAYIPSEKIHKVAFFTPHSSSFEQHVEQLNAEIDFEEMKKDPEKVLLCTLDYRVLGQDGSREMGRYLVQKFLDVLGHEDRFLALDEAHNFVDENSVSLITHLDKLFVILSDQSSMEYRADILDSILKNVQHVLCFNLDEPTAKVVNSVHPDFSVEEMMVLEKYYMRAKLNVKTSITEILKLKGCFPIPYSQN